MNIQPRILRILSACLGASVALVTVPLVGIALADSSEASRVGTVSYDRVQNVLSVPVEGSEPRVRVTKLAPRQYVADLANSVLIRAEVQGQRLRSPMLAGWSLDEMSGGRSVRLRLTLNEDTRPQVKFSDGGLLQVTFDAGPAPAEPRVTPRPLGGPDVAQGVKPVPVTKGRTTLVRTPNDTRFSARPAPTPMAIARSAVRTPRAPVVVVRRSPVPLVVARTVMPTSRPVTVAKASPMPPRRILTPVTVAKATALPTRRKLTPVAKVAVVRNPTRVAAVQKDPKKMPLVMIAARDPLKAIRRAATKVASRSPLRTDSQVATASLGSPRFDGARNMLIVPITGSLDSRRLAVIRLNRRWAYLDVPGAVPSFDGVRYKDNVGQVLDRWVMARRPGRPATRLSFALGGPTQLACHLSGRNLLVSVRPLPTMLGTAPRSVTVASASSAALRPTVAAVVRRTTVSAVRPAVSNTAETRLRRPFYDEERYGLVIPYEGRVPLYRWNAQDALGVSLEIKGDVGNAGRLAQDFRRHSVMGSWRLDRNVAAGTVRVAMTFARPSEVVVAADPSRHQLILIPQPQIAGADDVAVEGGVNQTTMSTVEVERDNSLLFIPFEGKLPNYTIEQVNPNFAYINFESSALKPGSVQFFSPQYHPTLNYWLLSQPNGRTSVRLAVALAQPGAASVYEDRSAKRLVVVLGDQSNVVRASGRPQPKAPEPWPGAMNPEAPPRAAEVTSNRLPN